MNTKKLSILTIELLLIVFVFLFWVSQAFPADCCMRIIIEKCSVDVDDTCTNAQDICDPTDIDENAPECGSDGYQYESYLVCISVSSSPLDECHTAGFATYTGTRTVCYCIDDGWWDGDCSTSTVYECPRFIALSGC